MSSSEQKTEDSDRSEDVGKTRNESGSESSTFMSTFTFSFKRKADSPPKQGSSDNQGQTTVQKSQSKQQRKSLVLRMSDDHEEEGVEPHKGELPVENKQAEEQDKQHVLPPLDDLEVDDTFYDTGQTPEQQEQGDERSKKEQLQRALIPDYKDALSEDVLPYKEETQDTEDQTPENQAQDQQSSDDSEYQDISLSSDQDEDNDEDQGLMWFDTPEYLDVQQETGKSTVEDNKDGDDDGVNLMQWSDNLELHDVQQELRPSQQQHQRLERQDLDEFEDLEHQDMSFYPEEPQLKKIKANEQDDSQILQWVDSVEYQGDSDAWNGKKHSNEKQAEGDKQLSVGILDLYDISDQQRESPVQTPQEDEDSTVQKDQEDNGIQLLQLAEDSKAPKAPSLTEKHLAGDGDNSNVLLLSEGLEQQDNASMPEKFPVQSDQTGKSKMDQTLQFSEGLEDQGTLILPEHDQGHAEEDNRVQALLLSEDPDYMEDGGPQQYHDGEEDKKSVLQLFEGSKDIDVSSVPKHDQINKKNMSNVLLLSEDPEDQEDLFLLEQPVVQSFQVEGDNTNQVLPLSKYQEDQYTSAFPEQSQPQLHRDKNDDTSGLQKLTEDSGQQDVSTLPEQSPVHGKDDDASQTQLLSESPEDLDASLLPEPEQSTLQQYRDDDHSTDQVLLVSEDQEYMDASSTLEQYKAEEDDTRQVPLSSKGPEYPDDLADQEPYQDKDNNDDLLSLEDQKYQDASSFPDHPTSQQHQTEEDDTTKDLLMSEDLVDIEDQSTVQQYRAEHHDSGQVLLLSDDPEYQDASSLPEQDQDHDEEDDTSQALLDEEGEANQILQSPEGLEDQDGQDASSLPEQDQGWDHAEEDHTSHVPLLSEGSEYYDAETLPEKPPVRQYKQEQHFTSQAVFSFKRSKDKKAVRPEQSRIQQYQTEDQDTNKVLLLSEDSKYQDEPSLSKAKTSMVKAEESNKGQEQPLSQGKGTEDQDSSTLPELFTVQHYAKEQVTGQVLKMSTGPEDRNDLRLQEPSVFQQYKAEEKEKKQVTKLPKGQEYHDIPSLVELCQAKEEEGRRQALLFYEGQEDQDVLFLQERSTVQQHQVKDHEKNKLLPEDTNNEVMSTVPEHSAVQQYQDEEDNTSQRLPLSAGQEDRDVTSFRDQFTVPENQSKKNDKNQIPLLSNGSEEQDAPTLLEEFPVQLYQGREDDTRQLHEGMDDEAAKSVPEQTTARQKQAKEDDTNQERVPSEGLEDKDASTPAVKELKTTKGETREALLSEDPDYQVVSTLEEQSLLQQHPADEQDKTNALEECDPEFQDAPSYQGEFPEQASVDKEPRQSIVSQREDSLEDKDVSLGAEVPQVDHNNKSKVLQGSKETKSEENVAPKATNVEYRLLEANATIAALMEELDQTREEIKERANITADLVNGSKQDSLPTESRTSRQAHWINTQEHRQKLDIPSPVSSPGHDSTAEGDEKQENKLSQQLVAGETNTTKSESRNKTVSTEQIFHSDGARKTIMDDSRSEKRPHQTVTRDVQTDLVYGVDGVHAQKKEGRAVGDVGTVTHEMSNAAIQTDDELGTASGKTHLSQLQKMETPAQQRAKAMTDSKGGGKEEASSKTKKTSAQMVKKVEEMKPDLNTAEGIKKALRQQAAATKPREPKAVQEKKAEAAPTSAQVKQEEMRPLERITFGGKGSELGKFNRPRGVAVSPKNEIFVADRDNRRIQVLNMKGETIRQIQTTVPDQEGLTMRPDDIAIDGNDLLWVVGSDWSAEFVIPYTMEGEPLGKFDLPDTVRFRGITVNMRNNNVIVTLTDKTFGTRGEVRVFRPDGWQLKRVGITQGMVAPMFVTLDKDDNILVSDYGTHSIYAYDQEGTFLFKFGGYGTGVGQLKDPRGICVDSSGHIIVADFGNKRIEMFTNRGKHVRHIANSTGRPDGIAVGPDGQLVVTEWNNTATIFPSF